MSEHSISAHLASFGEAVRLRRKRLGVSQRQAAKAIGSSQARLSRVESGQTCPSLSYAWRIADALGTSLPFLLIDAEAALADQRAERGAA